MAERRNSSQKREPNTQKVGTERNLVAQINGAKKAWVEAGDASPKPTPVLTGVTHDLGGNVDAVVKPPWVSIDGKTVYRGDVVKVTAEVADNNPSLIRL